MSEQEPQVEEAPEAPAGTPEPEEEAPEAPETDTFDEERAKAKIAKANSEAASLRKRLKELEPLAQKAQELEDAKKSETEKLNERLAAAEKRAQEAEFNHLRVNVAQEKGLTAAQARRLVGESREELESDADDLLASFAPKAPEVPKQLPGKPKESLRGGGDPTEEPEETDPTKLADLIGRDSIGRR